MTSSAELDPRALPVPLLEFCRERHLATLTTLRPDGTPHAVPVGFTLEEETGLVRVITSGSSRKARNVAENAGQPVLGRAAVCSVDGARWVTFEGPTRVSEDPDEVADAVRRYAERYRQPSENPQRVAVLVTVDRVLAGVRLRG